MYNIGTTHERSTLDVARSVCEYFRKDPEAAIEFVPDRLFNDRRRGALPAPTASSYHPRKRGRKAARGLARVRWPQVLY